MKCYLCDTAFVIESEFRNHLRLEMHTLAAVLSRLEDEQALLIKSALQLSGLLDDLLSVPDPDLVA